MKKQIVGIVVSDKMQKTVVVRIERKLRHPLYEKVITRHKRIKARNELEGVRVGDAVRIEETRPIAKDVTFQVVEKITDIRDIS